uniref:tRNA pseudouridine synthase A n=1 Tax=Lygus hesperus TaxID=30085 RepID=A0A0A9XZ76_LYGHE
MLQQYAGKLQSTVNNTLQLCRRRTDCGVLIHVEIWTAAPFTGLTYRCGGSHGQKPLLQLPEISTRVYGGMVSLFCTIGVGLSTDAHACVGRTVQIAAGRKDPMEILAAVAAAAPLQYLMVAGVLQNSVQFVPPPALYGFAPTVLWLWC